MESKNDSFTCECNLDADDYLNVAKIIKHDRNEDSEQSRQINLNNKFDNYFYSDDKFDIKSEIEEEFIDDLSLDGDTCSNDVQNEINQINKEDDNLNNDTTEHIHPCTNDDSDGNTIETTVEDEEFIDNLNIDGDVCINDVQNEINQINKEDDNLNNDTAENIHPCTNDNSMDSMDGHTIEPTVEDDQAQALNSEELSSSTSTIIKDDAIDAKTENERKFDSVFNENIKKLFFPQKLRLLIQDESFEGMNWSTNGEEIVINIEKIRPILSTISRSTKIQSFIRQLHKYKFRKTNNFRRERKLDRNIVCYFRVGFNREIVDNNIESLEKIFTNDKKK